MYSEGDGLKLELMFEREAQYKGLENFQSDLVVEKKNPYSGKELKPVGEICVSNKEPNVNNQDNEENVSRAYQRSLQQSLSSQAQKIRREEWFCG